MLYYINKHQNQPKEIIQFIQFIADTKGIQFCEAWKEVVDRFQMVIVKTDKKGVVGGIGLMLDEYDGKWWFGMGLSYAREQGQGNTYMFFHMLPILAKLLLTCKEPIITYGLGMSPLSYAKLRRLGFNLIEVTPSNADFFSDKFFNNAVVCKPTELSPFAFETVPPLQYSGPSTFHTRSIFIKEFFSVIPQNELGRYSLPLVFEITARSLTMALLRTIGNNIRRSVRNLLGSDGS